MEIHREEGLTFALIERKTPVLRPAIQLKQRSLCSLHSSWDHEGRGQMTRSSASQEQLTEKVETQEDHK